MTKILYSDDKWYDPVLHTLYIFLHISVNE